VKARVVELAIRQKAIIEVGVFKLGTNGRDFKEIGVAQVTPRQICPINNGITQIHTTQI
jgi:hypothetical protein